MHNIQQISYTHLNSSHIKVIATQVQISIVIREPNTTLYKHQNGLPVDCYRQRMSVKQSSLYCSNVLLKS